MARLSSILRSIGGGFGWWCPGCDRAHRVTTSGEHAWGFNGDVEKPTFTPSVLVTFVQHPGVPIEQGRCHSFVKDGKMQFLGDCTHALAGQTVDIPPFPGSFDA